MRRMSVCTELILSLVTDAAVGIPGQRWKLPIGRVQCVLVDRGVGGEGRGVFLGGVEVVCHDWEIVLGDGRKMMMDQQL
jgi:hypothetical protein